MKYGQNQSLSNVDAYYSGDAAGDEVSSSMANAGDVNGDGYDDLIFSGPKHDLSVGTKDAGAVYVVFGRKVWTPRANSVTDVNASFLGVNGDDNLGYSLDGAGDVNGDGYDDILVGATGADTSYSNAGKAYLIFGKKSGWQKDVSVSNANVTFSGEGTNNLAGFSVTGLGDVNGDGLDDIAISAPYNNEAGSGTGQVYVIFGRKSGWPATMSLSLANASFRGASIGNNLGMVVDSAGDTNNDKLDDILMTAPNANHGRAYIVRGKINGWAMDQNISTAANTNIDGGTDAESFGMCAAGVGDVDNNQADDIAVCYNDKGFIFQNKGEVGLFLGGSNGITASSLTQANSSFRHSLQTTLGIETVARVGDCNGDGFADIGFGVPTWDYSTFTEIGKTYVLMGSTTKWGLDYDISNNNLMAFQSDNPDDFSGKGLGGGGDIDSDGYTDLLIGAYMKDITKMITYLDAGRAHIAIVDHNIGPMGSLTLNIYSNKDCTNLLEYGSRNQTVYLQITGGKGDTNRKDLALVRINSSKGDPIGITIPLVETDKQTGIYRGSLILMNRSREEDLWLRVKGNETVTVTPVNKTSAAKSFFVRGDFALRPKDAVKYQEEDYEFSHIYWTEGCPPANVSWKLTTNASWLSWDETLYNVKGLPTNANVGKFSVIVNVTNDFDQSDEHNFVLTVRNVKPTILNQPLLQATEDLPYSVKMLSDEDGNGTITWGLKTNSSWLRIDPLKGYLNGTPGDQDIGKWYANITVDDGNGGTAFINKTITVQNINDVPNITSAPPLLVLEDTPIDITFQAQDPDPDEVLSWMLQTTASWLKFNGFTGRMNGTPTNNQVGTYDVNVTVNDVAGATDSLAWTLTVQNVNDPPVIREEPLTDAVALVTYYYPVKANDVDKGDSLTFSLKRSPTGMNINPKTGEITWIPTRDQGGPHQVTVSVTDGTASDDLSYTVTVSVPAHIPPQVTLQSPENGTLLEITNPQLTWTCESPDSKEDLYFEVYLSIDRNAVETRSTAALVSNSSSDLFYKPPTPLQKGKTYYWAVIPYDEHGAGTNQRGVWSFDIKADAVVTNKPTSVLTAPTNGSILETLPVQLSWTGSDPDNDPLLFTVYLASNLTQVLRMDLLAIKADGTNLTNFVVEGVSKDVTYYWTVVPYDGTYKGSCTSGVWSFIIKSTAVVNNRPEFTSKPVTVAYGTQLYNYQATATDDDSSDVLSFSLTKRPKNMIIGSDNGLIYWTPTDNDVGKVTITIRVSDGRLYAEQTFTIDVLPSSALNGPPEFKSTPELKGKAGMAYQYQPLVSDKDNDELTFELVEHPSGMKIDSKTGKVTWTPVKDQAGKHAVSIKVSDQRASRYQNYTLDVAPNPMLLTNSDTGLCLPLLLLGIIAVLIVVAVLVMRSRSKARAKAEAEAEEARKAKAEYEEERKLEKAAAKAEAAQVAASYPVAQPVSDEGVEDFTITELFLIYNDGRLIQHTTIEEGQGIDKEIMSSMLVAIQGFVKESFKTQQGLDSFEFGARKVILQGGKYFVLAVVLDGTEPQVLRDEMQSVVTNLEGIYAGKVEKWDGELDTFKDAEDMMLPLMELRYKLTIKEKTRNVKLKSGIEFYSGYVRLKVGVSNELKSQISNITLTLSYDRNTLHLSRIEPEYPLSDGLIYLPDIPAGEKRTVAVYFDPLICQESHIDGKVQFTDVQGNWREAEMKRRPVDVVCPIFYTVETINVAMLKRLLGELKYSDLRVYEVSDEKSLKEAHSQAVAAVRGHDVKLVREFVEEEPFQVETWFYGEAKESEEKLVIKVSARAKGNQIEIFVASDNLASMTGLLAELGSEFRAKMDEKGFDQSSLRLSTDETLKDTLKQIELLLDKYSEIGLPSEAPKDGQS